MVHFVEGREHRGSCPRLLLGCSQDKSVVNGIHTTGRPSPFARLVATCVPRVL